MTERSVYRSVGRDEDLTGIARRVAQISVSAIKQMPVLASKVGGCISLGQGIPSFATPSFIREAVIEALRSDETVGKYSLQPGLPALKEAIADRMRQTKGVPVDPESEIFISCGGMEALAGGLASIVERGDEVLLPSPNYASHIEQILFAEGVPVFVPLLEEEGWRLDLDGFRKAVTCKTKAIVICNPMNPTGAVFSREELTALAELALSRNLFIVADEAYDFLVYEDLPHFSLSSIPELKDLLIACYSFSKMYCMTGWRVGYMVAGARIIDQVLKVHDAFAICAPTISQVAALAALRATNGRDGEGDRFIRHLVAALGLQEAGHVRTPGPASSPFHLREAERGLLRVSQGRPCRHQLHGPCPQAPLRGQVDHRARERFRPHRGRSHPPFLRGQRRGPAPGIRQDGGVGRAVPVSSRLPTKKNYPLRLCGASTEARHDTFCCAVPLGLFLLHGFAAADDRVRRGTPAGMIHNDPHAADPALERRAFLGHCLGFNHLFGLNDLLGFDHLLGLGDFLLGWCRHVLSPFFGLKRITCTLLYHPRRTGVNLLSRLASAQSLFLSHG